MISHEELLERMYYDPETGIFTWKVIPNHSNRKVGQRAGYFWSDPNRPNHCHRSVSLKVGGINHSVLEHRLAWFYVYGEWPHGILDHIDMDSSNNAIGNLRVATNSENAGNQKVRHTNKLGIKGVCFHKASGKYISKIMKEGKYHHLGLFDNPLVAAEAYKAAASRLQGEFARY